MTPRPTSTNLLGSAYLLVGGEGSAVVGYSNACYVERDRDKRNRQAAPAPEPFLNVPMSFAEQKMLQAYLLPLYGTNRS